MDLTGKPRWRVFRMSSLDHPNIRAGLAGTPHGQLPVPAAVSVEQVEAWVADYCDPIPEEDRQAEDLCWPPEEHCRQADLPLHWYRPGPEFQWRVLGQWPSQGTFGVWSDLLWKSAVTAALAWDSRCLPVVGCDVARFGDDYTAIHVRYGPCSLHHESHNGWDCIRTADRLTRLAEKYAGMVNASRQPSAAPVRHQDIPVILDDTGWSGGSGVTDLLRSRGQAVTPVNAGTPAPVAGYPNLRSYLWFAVALRARRRQLDLHRLNPHLLAALKSQAMAPTWLPDALGQKKVEDKDDTKKKLGRSPDDMDALNLAYHGVDGPIETGTNDSWNRHGAGVDRWLKG